MSDVFKLFLTLPLPAQKHFLPAQWQSVEVTIEPAVSLCLTLLLWLLTLPSPHWMSLELPGLITATASFSWLSGLSPFKRYFRSYKENLESPSSQR